MGTSWPIGVAVGDFNNDGKPDVAVITAANGSDGATVLVLLGKGDGTLQSPLTSATNISPVTLATADFNKDGKLDLLVGGSGSAAVLLGKGDGTFQPAPNLPPVQNQTTDIQKQWALGAADLNGDGCSFGAP